MHSNRARSKVRQWFKAQQHEETVAQGRALVERELARLGRTALKLDAVAAKAGFDKTEEFFAAFARDDINSKQVQTAILAVAQPGAPPRGARRAGSRDAAEPRERLGQRHPRRRRRPAADRACALLQAGAARSDRRLRHARQGRDDPSRDRAATSMRMRATQPERLIDADWGAPRDEVFPVDIVVEAMDRQGLLRDISEVLSREKINVTAANTLTKNLHSRMAFTIEVRSLDALKRALAYVRDVKGVLNATRR